MARELVVGFDGSNGARAALAYATRRALSGDRIVVAHVLDVPAAMLESPYYERALERAREHGGRVLDEAKGAMRPGAPAATRLVEGSPARALVELARELGADEIAVGSRGFGSLRAAVLGSTSHALLHESDRPVGVVPRRAVDRELRLAGTPAESPAIVLGYDGSGNARAALDHAVGRADAAGGHVVAVCAFYAPADWRGAPWYGLTLEEHEQRARELTSGLEDRPDVEVEIVSAPPVDALIRTAHARDAAEIVVGARGLGRFQAALGSVSLALVHEADLPVVVVPSQDPSQRMSRRS